MSKPRQERLAYEPWRVEEHAKQPHFREVDVFVEPDGDRWRVDVISRPGNRVVASDHYPDEGLAVARAQDFARMLEQLWWQFDVRVHRRFKGRSDL